MILAPPLSGISLGLILGGSGIRLFFTFVKIVQNCSPICSALHNSMSHSGASLTSLSSRVTVRDSCCVYKTGIWEVVVILVQDVGKSGAAEAGVFRSLSGPWRTVTSPTGSTIFNTEVHALLFLEPAICHPFCRSSDVPTEGLYLPGSLILLATALNFVS